MPRFHLPTFNLMSNITGCDTLGVPAIPTPPFRETGVACALVYGQRVNMAANLSIGSLQEGSVVMNLLLPPRTDVRGPQDSTSTVSAVCFDMVEVPAGSGRWYSVLGVDDIGKGWPNEHRVAHLLSLYGSWVHPYP